MISSENAYAVAAGLLVSAACAILIWGDHCWLWLLRFRLWRNPKLFHVEPRPIIFIRRPLIVAAWKAGTSRVECTWDSQTGAATMTVIDRIADAVSVRIHMAMTSEEPHNRSDWERLEWQPATENYVRTQ